jgi:hypothetical protein
MTLTDSPGLTELLAELPATPPQNENSRGGVALAALSAAPLPLFELDAHGDRLITRLSGYLTERIRQNSATYDTSRLMAALEILSTLERASSAGLSDAARADKFWRRAGLATDRHWGLLASGESLGPSAPCWEWQGAKRSSDGLGVLSWNGKLVSAHRKAYELFYGIPLAKGAWLRRLCATPHCVNVRDHYEHRRVAGPRLLDSAKFRAGLEESYAEANYCTQGHSLRDSQRKSDCGECHRERRNEKRVERDRLAKEGAEAYLSPRADAYRSVANSLLPDLSGLMEP